MKRLMWVGDAACDSGFARCTHYTLEALRKRWDITVLGLNYLGDPHKYPYRIFPAWPGGDLFGVKRIAALVASEKPDIIVLQNDPWNIPAYMKAIEDFNVPVVGTIAVDGKNCRGRSLNKLERALFWTAFGEREAIEGGLSRPSAVVPLGVDLDIYKPGDRRKARQQIGLPEHVLDAFIVGNVNRNQPRKRLDLTLAYFAEWIKREKIDDAYLFLHVAPTGDQGYDCNQLADYYGLAGRVILAEPEVFQGTSEAGVAATYRCFDVQMTTTQGEGWGLTTLEGMACGIPQIVPDWAALGEWADAAIKIECTSTITTPQNINSVGGIADREAMIQTLDYLYREPYRRESASAAGIELASRPMFRWDAIGEKFADEVDIAYGDRG